MLLCFSSCEYGKKLNKSHITQKNSDAKFFKFMSVGSSTNRESDLISGRYYGGNAYMYLVQIVIF